MGQALVSRFDLRQGFQSIFGTLARAVSGYPRTRSGRTVDAAHENLAQLAAAHDLDDYTFNLAPAPTPGDDLTLLIDANGDLR